VRSELISSLSSNDDTEFALFNSQNDAEGTHRTELINSRLEKEAKRVELKCEVEIAHEEGEAGRDGGGGEETEGWIG
jgi:hypothetical protein